MTEVIMRKKKWKLSLILLLIVLASIASSVITDFNAAHGIASIPGALQWILSNMYLSEQAMERFPMIMNRLLETIFMSIAATTSAAVVSIFLGIMGSKVTRINPFLSSLARLIASFTRNIPVVAWALILLISFGQNSMTGYLALFAGTVGFLTRAFIETIDEANESAVEALRATGAMYPHIINKAVLPQSMPQIISWVLFMVETNIRSATLVGILTGTGIGFVFDMYYKTMDYNTVALVTYSIIITVICIELISNYVRKVIL